MLNDKRIQYYRQEINKGAAYNFQFVLNKATGEYFMWAADDDEWDSTYISQCLSVMIKHPEVVLCSSQTNLIDSTRKHVGIYFDDVDTIGLPKLARIKKVILGIRRNTTFHGLRRTEITKKIPTRNQYGYDHVYMMQLSFYGSFVILPEVLFSCSTGGMGSSPNQIIRDVGGNSALIKLSPSLFIMRSYFEEILKAELSNKEKLFTGLFVFQRYLSPPYVFNIIKDFLRLPLKLLGLAPMYRK
jgi:glycosyltransferase involved in cell wall biosynthesis